MDFSNKVVIITGASSGIGAATAEAYAKQSAKLVLVARNEQALNKVANKCKSAKGINPLIVKADLTSDEQVKNIVTKTVEAFGRIDILVNNAGLGVSGSITDGIKPFDDAISINVRSAYLLAGLATPHLIKSKGNIINVSSIAGFGPIADVDFFMPYCISKAAMDMFTKCLALDLGPEGVRVNSVNPGLTRSAFNEAAGFSKEQVAEFYKKRASIQPLRKIAESEDVADLILFLSSDRARSITGTTHLIDNGDYLL